MAMDMDMDRRRCGVAFDRPLRLRTGMKLRPSVSMSICMAMRV